MISKAHNRETNKSSSKMIYIMVQGEQDCKKLKEITTIKDQPVIVEPYINKPKDKSNE
jgi:hypothetical protein